MRCGSTDKVLTRCKLEYNRITKCTGSSSPIYSRLVGACRTLMEPSRPEAAPSLHLQSICQRAEAQQEMAACSTPAPPLCGRLLPGSAAGRMGTMPHQLQMKHRPPLLRNAPQAHRRTPFRGAKTGHISSGRQHPRLRPMLSRYRRVTPALTMTATMGIRPCCRSLR